MITITQYFCTLYTYEEKRLPTFGAREGHDILSSTAISCSVFLGLFCWNLFDCRFCLDLPVWSDDLLYCCSRQITFLIPLVLHFNSSLI